MWLSVGSREGGSSKEKFIVFSSCAEMTAEEKMVFVLITLSVSFTECVCTRSDSTLFRRCSANPPLITYSPLIISPMQYVSFFRTRSILADPTPNLHSTFPSNKKIPTFRPCGHLLSLIILRIYCNFSTIFSIKVCLFYVFIWKKFHFMA